jgi:uncharacterized protein DUF1298
MAGHKMVDYIGLLPLGANMGFGVPIISYNQNLYFTMMAEPNLMSDPEHMKSLVEEVFVELKQAAAAQGEPAPVQQRRDKKPKYAGASGASVSESPHPGLAALSGH